MYENQHLTVSAAELNRRFGEIQSRATRAPVIVTHHGKPRLAIVSMDLFERIERSEREEASSPLRALESKVGLILDNITEGYISIDQEWRLVTINRVAEMFIGQSRDQLIGKRWHDAFPRADLVESYVRRTLQTGEALQLETASSLHPARQVTVTVFPLARSSGGAGVLFANITERSRIERERDQLQAQNSELLDLLNFIALREDTAGYIRAWNSAAETMFGWSREDAIGKAASRFLGGDPLAFATKDNRQVHVRELPSVGDWSDDFGRVRIFEPVDK